MSVRFALAGMFVAACHASPQLHADAGEADGDVDAGPTGVDVTVYTSTGDGAPVPTAVAIFTDADGTLVQAEMVDANGHAHAEMPQGGTVTVLVAADDPNDPRRNEALTTFRGVKAGDQLVVGRSKDASYRAGTTDIMKMSYTPINTSSGPYLFAACPDNGIGPTPPITLTFHQSCEATSFDLLLLQDNTSNSRFYVWQPGIPFSAGDTFTVPDNWQAIGHNTTTFVNIPANLANVTSDLDVVIDGAAMQLDRESIQLPPPGAGTLSLEYVPEITKAAIVTSFGVGLTYTERHAIIGAPASVSLDLASLPLPRVTRVSPNATGVTWAETHAGSPDARLVTWFGSWSDGTRMHQVLWEIEDAGAPDTAATLPGLPDAYAGDDPTRQMMVQLGGASVTYFDYDNLDGYDAARASGPDLQRVEAQFLSADHHAHLAVMGSN